MTTTAASRQALGAYGETLAARLLTTERGMLLLDRNWRCPEGELDLVLRDGDVLVACEVKTRRGTRFGSGFDAVDARKRRKLRAVGEVFLQRTRVPPVAVRFDVASVRLRLDGSAVVDVFEDAF